MTSVPNSALVVMAGSSISPITLCWSRIMVQDQRMLEAFSFTVDTSGPTTIIREGDLDLSSCFGGSEMEPITQALCIDFLYMSQVAVLD